MSRLSSTGRPSWNQNEISDARTRSTLPSHPSGRSFEIGTRRNPFEPHRRRSGEQASAPVRRARTSRSCSRDPLEGHRLRKSRCVRDAAKPSPNRFERRRPRVPGCFPRAEAAAAGRPSATSRSSQLNRRRCVRRRRFISAECIAEPMCGANEPRLPGRISERLPYLGDQAGQIRLGNERCGPEMFVHLVFRERARSIIDEDFQQLERFGRSRNFRATPKQLAPIGVECHAAKVQSHDATYQKPGKRLGIVKDSRVRRARY